jgi:hypothetical protein
MSASAPYEGRATDTNRRDRPSMKRERPAAGVVLED